MDPSPVTGDITMAKRVVCYMMKFITFGVREII